MPRRRRFRPCVPGKREPNGRLSRAKPDRLDRCAQEELALKLVAFLGKLPKTLSVNLTSSSIVGRLAQTTKSMAD
jgi:hypothetical protein